MKKSSERRAGPMHIGLTGGIASGKSLVADYFATRKVPVIDADVIARELMEPGTPVTEKILAEFGSDLLDESRNLDRAKLRRLAFGSRDVRRRLEAITHPAILSAMSVAADSAGGPYLLMVVPLLVEANAAGMVDRVLVVDCATSIQLERLTHRDGIDLTLARKMLDAQATREQRLAIADEVIENSGSPEDAESMVARLDRFYRRLAADDQQIA